MKFKFLFPIAFFVLHTIPGAAQCIPEDGRAFYKRAMKEINPKHTTWIKNKVTDIRSGKTLSGSLTAEATAYVNTAKLAANDIEALV